MEAPVSERQAEAAATGSHVHCCGHWLPTNPQEKLPIARAALQAPELSPDQ